MRDHAENEYKRWKSGFVKVIHPAKPVSDSGEELKEKVEAAVL